MLLGPSYVMLRHPFLEAAKQSRHISRVENLFICMGGADPLNITAKVVMAADQCEFIQQIDVVIGSVFAYVPELEQLCKKSNKKIIIHQNIDDRGMVGLLTRNHLAVAPASSVSLEICAVKLGLLTGMFVDNQKFVHDFLIKNNCAFSLGDLKSVTVEQISSGLNELNDTTVVQRMIRQQSAVIDGHSSQRLIEEFTQLVQC
jgi:spore coat polysaccharide biosynthesis predicted glycosyltransferase SpsG